MKKMIKGILLLVILAAAVLLGCLIYARITGNQAIMEKLDGVTGGRATEWTDTMTEWGNTISGKVPQVNYEVEDAMHFSQNHEIKKGSMEKSIAANGEGIKKLSVEAGGCRIALLPSEDANFRLETGNTEAFQYYTEDETFFFITSSSTQSFDSGKQIEVFLYLPVKTYAQIKINLGAGSLECSDLKTEDLILDVGAGKAVLDNCESRMFTVNVGMGSTVLRHFKAEALDASVDMGALEASGACDGDLSLKTAMGKLELELEDEKTAFDYEVRSAMGNILLADREYSGVTVSESIDNGAKKKIWVECSMGNMIIRFK